MRRWCSGILVFVGGSVLLLGGCRSHAPFVGRETDAHFQRVATQIEYPNVQVSLDRRALSTPQPRTVRNDQPLEVWELSLEEALRTTLTNSEVIRGLGARVVTAPVAVSTVYDPAIRESDPLFGPQAALSDFDAQFATSLFFNRNERTPNNFFLAGGAFGLSQNTAAMQTEIRKRAATGTLFSVRNLTDYDRSNIPIPPNRFPSAYNTIFEANIRQPLLQGAGIEFNRIAGPDARPGVYNGLLIGRINTDISLADFEASIRDLLMEVERSYWQLYFTYRDLDARVAARDAALQTWRAVQSRREAGLPNADSEREALAREQLFAARAAVDNGLSGSATSGLVVSTSGGIYTVERQLRYLMGVPVNDGRLIRPSDEPSTVDVVFDWQDSLRQALTRRVELRRQRWTIKRREMELTAARNFLRMKLDFVGTYRFRGFGDNLLGNRHQQNGSAFEDLFSGDLQEWQLGMELNTPIGNRIGHTAVHNAEWNLRREMAVYQQQEQEITRELSRAFAELDRAYSVSRANYNRSRAAQQQLEAVQAKYEAGLSLLEFVIDAQRRTAEASSAYFRSLVDYSTAIASVHLARGTLLDYMNVYLTEAPWSEEDVASAAKQARRFHRSRLNYSFTIPRPVSAGVYGQTVPRLVQPDVVPGDNAANLELVPDPVAPLPAP